MKPTDTLALSNAPITRINELARWCNLQVVGTRGVWWVRKSATSPVTRKEYFFKRSTKTADLRTAVMRALPWVEEFTARIANPHGPSPMSSSTSATIAELEVAYLAAPTVEASEDTRKKNIKDLHRILRLVHPDLEIATASTRLLSKSLAKDYQSARLKAAKRDAGEDREALESSKRGINAALRHAQSIFCKQAMDDYSKIVLPETVREFATALPIPARDAEEPVQLPDDFVRDLMQRMAAHKQADLTVWSIFQLFVWAGLRNIETIHVRIGWLEEIPAGYRIALKPAGDYIPKGRSASRVIPKPIALELLEAAAEEKGLERRAWHLVPALNATDRHDAAYRRLNAWLREQGVTEDANKIAYRLRKYFFAKMAEQQGLMLALAAHGGGDLSTLTNHYTGAPKMNQPIKLGAEP